ncbi:UNVERIFIED_ORG: DinB family protein [Roseateles sp. XES5]|nr:DinB family protein [Roseateles sp. XES5]
MQGLYRYNAWANAALFETLRTLDPQRHAAERRTALRLVNHLHIVSRIFAAHLAGVPHGYSADNTEETPELEALHAALAASDRWYCDYLRTVPPAALSEAIPFQFTDGDSGRMTRAEMLAHVVLHAGYHRGEVGRLLWQIGITPPWDTFAVYLHQSEPARRSGAVAG